MQVDTLEDIYPLTPTQQGMLFHALYEPESEAYFEQLSCRLRGALDVAAFRRAWQQILDRHPALRTAFDWEELEEPVQLVMRQVELPCEEHDWRRLGAERQEEELAAFLKEDRRRGFSLDRAPLMRLTLIRLGDEEHAFVWSHHHLLIDGWCLSLLLREVLTAYEAFREGREPVFGRSRPFREYVAWLESRDPARSEGYWRQALAGLFEPTPIPIVGPPAEPPAAGGAERCELFLAEAATRSLEALARDWRVTLSTVVQGAWALLLGRYSGADEVLFGVTVAGRPPELPGVESMVGLFINTLPLRVALPPRQPLGPWLQQLQMRLVDMREHEHTPLTAVESWSALPPGQPSFDSLLAFENYPLDQALLAERGTLGVERVSVVEQTNYPLTAVAAPGRELTLKLARDARRVAGDAALRALVHWSRLLTGFLDSPDATLGDLTMLSQAERRQLLVEWNDSRVSFATDLRLGDLLAAQVARAADAAALTFEEQTLTYGELGRRVAGLAHRLRHLGVGPEVRVGVCLERSLELVIALHAVVEAGGAYVPLDPDHPAERLAYMLADAGVSAILTTRDLADRFAAFPAPVLCLDNEGRSWLGSPAPAGEEAVERPLTPDSLAYVIYTSGSTGRPKGVMNTHRGIVNRLLWMQAAYSLGPHDSVLQKTPFSFDVSVWEFFWPLAVGARLVVLRPGGHRQADHLIDRIVEESLTTLHFVPSMLRAWLAEPAVSRCLSLRRVFSSGEALPADLVRRFGELSSAELHNLYGPTEAAVDVTAWPCDPKGTEASVPIGRPIANLAIHLLDRAMEPVPIGIFGELYIGGIGLARGYQAKPELTAERFVPNPWGSEPGEHLYKSGDLAVHRRDGGIEYLGRIDHQVKLRGFRIELEEIEAALRLHSGVHDAAVALRSEGSGEPRLVAYAALEPGFALSLLEMQDLLRTTLPEYMVPSVLVILDFLPVSANGKLDRRALPAVAPAGSGLGAGTAPRSPQEEMLAEIWAEVLGAAGGRLGIHDDFFALGGNSLLAMQVTSRVRRTFGVDLPVRGLFEAPTIARLAQALEGRGGERPAALPLVRIERRDELPLSFAQQRLWFLDQLNPAGALYNVTAPVRLLGALDEGALARAFAQVVARHESLRTSIHTVDGQPVQRIAPPRGWSLPVVDLSGIAGGDGEALRLLAADEIRPFDLGTAPLMRAALLRQAPDEHVLLITLHHIVADGWSIGVLVRDLLALYHAGRAGLPAALPELAIQYADFAVWQRLWLSGDVLEDQLAFWRRQLEGELPVLNLPGDRARPAAPSFRGGSRSRGLSPAMTARCRELGRGEGATLFMVLAAGFQALLGRLTGETDLPLGTPVANRNQPEVEGLIGLFVNTLVLRGDLRGDPSLRTLLLRTRERALAAYAHQDVPFERLVDELGIARSLSHGPLFQVMFALQNAPLPPLDAEGLEIRPLELASAYEKFDLSLILEPRGEGLAARLGYSRDLFDAPTAERLLGHLLAFLAGALDDEELPLSAVSWLGAGERAQLLTEWNDGRLDWTDDPCLHDLFERQVERTPDAVAMTDGVASLSYRQLDRQAGRWARRLSALGVGPEAVVALCAERSLEAIAGLLGILKAGGAFLPLDPDYPAERLNFMIEDARASLVLTQESLADLLPARAKKLFLGGERTALPEEPTAPSESGGGSASRLLYVIYTSGSTGKPKGVMEHHRGLVNRFRWAQRTLPLTDRDRVLLLSSFGFDISVWESLAPLLAGGQLVLARPGGQRDAGYLVEALREHEVTVVHFVPSLLQAVAEEEGFAACVHLRCLLCGGEALSAELLEGVYARFAAGGLSVAVHHQYGPTEAAINATVWISRGERTPHPLPIGRPLANCTAYVVDEALSPSPIGVRGELLLGGAGVARGYRSQPDLTAERFLPDPFGGRPGERLYRTGDRARFLPGGDLEFLGRTDDQVKIRGVRVEPAEVEAALQGLPPVENAAVLARGDAQGRPRLIAYFVPRAGFDPTPGELRGLLARTLPESMLPALFVRMRALPVGAHGKLDRRALPAPADERPDLATERVAPRTGTEASLATIWRRILGLSEVGVHDNFFELGGDSILSIQLVSQARKADLRLTPKQIFEHQTIAELARALESAGETAREGLESPFGPVPLTPVQARFFAGEPIDLHHQNQALLLALDTGCAPRALERAFLRVVEHHDALRARFERTPSGWAQEVPEPPATAWFGRLDLSALAAPRRSAAVEAAAAALQPSLDLGRGPLARAAFFDLGGEGGARLLLLAHHLVVDAVSWRILLEDLESAYRALAQGHAADLGPKTTSFREWAKRLEGYARGTEIRSEAKRWLAQPEPAARLPLDRSGPNTVGSSRRVEVSAGEEETRHLLQELPKSSRAQLQDFLLAALGQSLAQGSGSRRILVDLEGHGREEILDGVDLTRTVGWLTALYPVVLEVDSHPVRCLQNVKQQLRQVPRHGIGYGLLRYGGGDEEVAERLAGLPAAEVAFNYLGRLDLALPENSIFHLAAESPGPARSPRQLRHHALEIDAAVIAGRLRITWTYSENLHRRETVERLAARFLDALGRLAAAVAEVGIVHTPSDFPLARLEDEDFFRLMEGDPGIEDLYPLSPMQQGILFHSLFDPASPVYVSRIACTLRGRLDLAAFESAWREVLERHPALRTAFLWQGLAEPLQVVRRDVALPLARSAREENQGFDLTRAPLMRLSLVPLADDLHRLVWDHHHLLLDGWSLAQVMGEVFSFYAAALDGQSPPVREARPYRDHIAWLETRDLAEAEQFWRRWLADYEEPVSLGVKAAALPGSPAGRFGEIEHLVPASTTLDLERMARQCQVTLGTLLQGAWALLLSRYGRCDDVVFGSVVAGRPAEIEGVEAIVGLFTNTLPVRVRLAPQDRLSGWLKGLQAGQIELRQYEWSPLVQVQKWSQVPQGTPLFETLFAFEKYPVDVGVVAQSRSLEVLDSSFAEHTGFPVSISVYPGTAIRLHLAHDLRRLEPHAAERMAAHLANLLAGLAEDPDRPMAEISLLAPAEASQILIEWGRGGEVLPPVVGVHHLFEAASRRHPDQAAVVAKGASLSYRELDARADRLARRLQTLGVGPEILVGICLERSPELAVALLAVLKAGGACLPMDPAFPAERLGWLVDDAGPAWVLGRRSPGTPAGGGRWLVLEDEEELAKRAAGVAEAVEVDGENLAYTIYTSGSTGRPKGVMTSHRALVTYSVDMVEHFGLGASDRILQFAPISFDVLLEELLPTWTAGGAVVFADPEDMAHIAGLRQVIESHAVTGVELPAGYWHEWVDDLTLSGSRPPSSLRFVLVGCDKPAEERVERWTGLGLPLTYVFGLTETTITNTLHRVAAGVAGSPAAFDLPIGRAVAGSQVYVLDPHLRPLPAGVAGELFIGGPGLARGYLDRRDLTAARFIPHPFGGRGERLYRTGDLARFRPEGDLEFLGRNDHQVKVRGFRIEPGEVENVLCQHPAVAEAVVVARGDRPAERRLIAYVTAREKGGVPPAGELRRHVASLLPDHMVPSLFVTLDRLPLSANGKIDRRALPAPELTIAPAPGELAAPGSEVERQLARIWQAVLRLDQIGVHDSFFELGGDSILSIQIVSRAHQAGLRITPRQLFDHPTIAGLAAVVDRSGEARRDLETAAVTGDVALTPIEEWFFGQEPRDPHHFNMSLLLDVAGRPDLRALAAVATGLVERHDALRLRFTRAGSAWRQACLASPEPSPWAAIDFGALPSARTADAQAAACSQLQAGFDLAAGPLLRVVWLGGGEPGARLLLLAHHLVVDGVSWRILTEELELASKHLEQGEPWPLSQAGTPFGAWAQRLARAAREGDFDGEVEDWAALGSIPFAPLPLDLAGGENTVGSAAVVRRALAPHETRVLLREMHQAYRTRVNDILLAGLALTFARWTGGPLLVDLEGHGREAVFPDLDVSRTVGWLTSLFPVALAADPAAPLGEAVKAAKERLRRIPNGGLGFGVLRYLADAGIRERLAALPARQVLVNYLGQIEQGTESSRFSLATSSAGPGQSPRALRGYLFEINSVVVDGRFEVEWTFSRACHHEATVERLAEGYLAALRELAAHCLTPGARGYTPSDFPLASLDQGWLDRLAAEAPPVDDVYPLSPMQQGMLFHSLYDPAAGMYVAQFPCELAGALDTAAFRAAWEELANRHEALRSAFLEHGLAEPQLVIFRQVELPWVELDWRDAAGAEQEERLAAFLREDRKRGFDPARAPLTRFALLRTGDDTYRFVWSLHQMVADGWSLPLLFGEVFSLYEAAAEGREVDLGPPRPYREYVRWLKSQDLDGAGAYWRELLAGFTTPTPLPAGGRSSGRDGAKRYAERQVELSPAATDSLRTFARREDLTLNTLVQAAWALLLGRHGGVDDVVFGVVLSGRPGELPGVESMVGLFINSLPLRLPVPGDARVRDWLPAVQRRQAELLHYQFTPLARVQAWSPVERGRALFDTILAFQNYPLDRSIPEGKGGLRLRVEGSIEQTNYPETLVVFPGERLTLNLKVDQALVDGAAIAPLLGHLERLLGGMVEDPGRRLSELPLLSAAERRQLLEDWNVAVPSVEEPASLVELFESQARENADRLAVSWQGESLGYAELERRANGLARHLLSLGVAPGSLVGLCLERSLELVVGIVGILKAGCAYVPMEPGLPAERLALLAEDSGIAVLVSEGALAGRLSGLGAALVRVEETGWSAAAPGLAIAPQAAAYVIYTSGSTGQPKGVVVSHGNVARLLSSTAAWFGFRPEDVWTLFHSSAFDFSVWELWGALAYGGRLVVVPYLVSRSPESFYELLVGEGVTVLNQTPSAFRQWTSVEERGGDAGALSLRYVVFGGEALEFGALAGWYSRHGERSPLLVNMYGITETTVHVTYREVGVADVGGGSRIGRAIPDLQTHVVDRDLRLVPVGVAGELCVGGAGLGWGYLGRAELTAERFVANPYGLQGGDRLYRSGDLVRWLGSGELEYLGRIDHQVKVRGFRIELGEIESVLNRHEGVRESVVVVREGRLVGYVALSGDGVSLEDLRRHLGTRLPEYMIPAAFVRLASLPLTENGKVDRRALPSPQEGGERLSSQGYAAPGTARELALAGVWSRVLGVERVGLEDNFFSLGGDSILSLQVRSQSREAGIEFTLQELFEHPTIGELLAVLEEGNEARPEEPRPAAFALIAEEDRHLLPAGIEDAYPLTRLQAGMLFHSDFNPGSAIYHNVWSVRVTAPFDEPAARGAVDSLLARHPVLRTSFDLARYGEPLQLVHERGEAVFEATDLRPLSEAEQRAHLARWFLAEQERRFDWTRPSLVRFHLQRLSDAKFHFGLTEHHAILDGWSVASLTTELFQLYFARLRGTADGLGAPPAALFRDQVAAERQALADAAQRAFWTGKLEDRAISRLPPWGSGADGNPAGETAVGRFEVAISLQLSDRLKGLAREESVPVKSVLLAAHLRVIQALGGQTTVVTGLVTNGRPEGPDGERVLGLFLNTLPLSLTLPGGSWRELVRQSFAAEMELLAHRRYPMAELQRERGGGALFETAFNFAHFHVLKALSSLGVEAEESQEFAETEVPLIADFGLDLIDDGIRLGLTPGVGKIAPEQLVAIGGFYAAALEALGTAPALPYEQASLMSAGARWQLLAEWNATAAPLPAIPTVHGLFEARAAELPLAPAVVCGDESLTFGELNGRANRLARHLASLGVGRGALVGLHLDRGLEMVVAMLGVLKAGGAYVPLDPSYPRERLAFLLGDTAVPVVLTTSDLMATLPGFEGEVVSLDLELERIAAHSCENLAPGLTGEDLAYVMYTSGSTGQPKGVEIRHRGVVRLVFSGGHARFGAATRQLALSPLAFDASTLEIWGPLLHGGRCVLLRERVPAAADLRRAIERHGIDSLHLTTSLYNAVVDAAPEALAGIEQLLVGGEAPSVRHIRKGLELLGARRFVACYGPTESTTFTCCYPLPRTLGEGVRSILLGRPIDNTRVYLLDRSLAPVAAGALGELCVGGAGLARGYLRRPELTAERFIPDPFGEEPGQRLYRTGDLARHLPDGTIEFGGRLDDQVKIRGFRIEPGEVEAALLQDPRIGEAVALVREDLPGSKRLVAYVVPAREAQVSEGEVLRFLADKLPEHMLPGSVLVLEAIPLKPSGKVDRQALPAPERAAAAAEGERALPQSETEQVLARIWEQLLGVPVGRHDNFLALGGDSILSIQVVARARQAGLRLTPQQLFLHPTLAELAPVATPALGLEEEQGPVTGDVPLTPVQAWFLGAPRVAPHHWNQAVLLEVRDRIAPAALAAAAAALLRHHDALRLRFDRLGEGWRQHLGDPAEPAGWARLDLSALPEARRRQGIEAAAAAVQGSLDLSRGPLLRVVSFDAGGAGRDRLLFVIHHLAVDGVSWRVLLEDFQAACGEAASGREIRLPAKTTSFKRWAERLRDHARSAAVRGELEYWAGQPWHEAPALALDHPEGANSEGSARLVSTSLSAVETRQLLQEVAAAWRTHIDDVLLAALLRAFHPFTGQPSLLVEMEGHGRDALAEGVDVSRTVGWFTALFPLLLRSGGDEEPGALLKRVKEQVRAVPGRGSGYGLLRFLGEDAEVRRRLAGIPQAEVLFNYLGQFDQVLDGSAPFEPAAESAGPASSPLDRRRHRLEVSCLVSEGRLRIDWTYSQSLHDRSTIERLAESYVSALRELIAACLSARFRGATPSDFPLASLAQAEIDQIATEHGGVEDLYPLSPTQQGLLFHSLYSPGTGAYVTQVAAVLAGQLDTGAWEQACQHIVDRHPVLRTAFLWEDPDRLLQVVSPKVPFPLETGDWSALPPAERQAALADLVAANRSRGFDLSRAPLLRLSLFRLGEEAHQLLWCVHHLLLDGWSLSIVLEDLLRIYAGLRRREEPALRGSKPYRDYIAWLARQDLAESESFWRRALAGVRAATPLPEGAPGGQGRREARLSLSAATTAELQGLARRQHLTLSSLFQGVWGLILGHLSGQDEVVFGATVSGRPAELPGVESMVGLFINTLPLRLSLGGGAELADWLQGVQKRTVEMRRHEHTPLASILRWSELPVGQTLFESLLVFENYPVAQAVAGSGETGLTLQEVEFEAFTHYPLAVRITPGEEISIEVLYDAGRFEPALAARILGLFERALSALLAAPRAGVEEFRQGLKDAEARLLAQQRQDLRSANAMKLRGLKRAG